jgi:peptidoglycan/xylan/chitin deacetylase (PgdA/CDA1 family)
LKRAFPLVLCYHAASASWKHALGIAPATIERQVALLQRLRYTPVSMENAVARRGRLFHVTFDDAFRSVANVLPALERLRVPVTIFACPHFADAGAPLSVPELASEPAHELATMPWEELEHWSSRGVAIEPHTMSHPHLPRLSDDELEIELQESKEQIEDRLRRRCTFMAYPFGDEDARVHRAVEKAGYDGAFALPGQQSPLNRFALPRVGVYRGDGTGRFLLKTSLAGRRAAGRGAGRSAPSA